VFVAAFFPFIFRTIVVLHDDHLRKVTATHNTVKDDGSFAVVQTQLIQSVQGLLLDVLFETRALLVQNGLENGFVGQGCDWERLGHVVSVLLLLFDENSHQQNSRHRCMWIVVIN
jgi:hypothetical protein